MEKKHDHSENSSPSKSFFDRPTVLKEEIPVGKGVPVGFEEVYHSEIQIGGVYGTWGEGYDNEALVGHINRWLDEQERAGVSAMPRLLSDEEREQIYAQYFREDLERTEELLRMDLSRWKHPRPRPA